jgi:hypothetical protein
MSLKDEKAADAAELLAEIGEPVVWNGNTYNAIITALDLSDILQIGGFGENYDFTVKIAKAALGDARPQLNDPIEFDGITYRIAKTSESPTYPMVTLTVRSK